MCYEYYEYSNVTMMIVNTAKSLVFNVAESTGKRAFIHLYASFCTSIGKLIIPAHQICFATCCNVNAQCKWETGPRSLLCALSCHYIHSQITIIPAVIFIYLSNFATMQHNIHGCLLCYYTSGLFIFFSNKIDLFSHHYQINF